MKRFKLTDEHKEFIRNNFQNMSRNKMARELGIGITPINTFMKKNGLRVSKEQSILFRTSALKGRTTFSQQEDQFIKDNYLSIPLKTLAKKIGRSGCGVKGRMKALNLVIPKELANQRKLDSHYKKGRIPENKGKKQTEFMSLEAIERTKATRFRKGHRPNNTAEVGTEAEVKGGYIKVKISEPNNWELKQRLVYQNHHNVSLTSEDAIVFIDGDIKNFDPENLKKLSRAELMDKNSIHRYPKELKDIIRLNSKLIKQINKQENGKK